MEADVASATGSTFRVVCFGGSAGALNAYLEILRHLPADTGMAFVVVAHRAAEHAHLLPEALSAATSMPVIEVEHGARLEPNRVFVAPAGVDMTLNEGRLLLAVCSKPHGWPITISIFLHSLAESAGPRAVAVILSGRDYDGSSEMAAIKAAGGVTFAQANAPYGEMPRAAVATGHVDFVLGPTGIATGLLALSA
jgi:two-component system, chemotaxis family, CheB/CheR fusion protein